MRIQEYTQRSLDDRYLSNPSWLASMEYRFTKKRKPSRFQFVYLSGDSFEIIRDRKTIVTMHLAGDVA